MKVLKITKQSIKEAIFILEKGGIVIYPTETAYALGCDAKNARAKAKIFKIKNRPKEKNLPMICATKKMALEFFKLGKMERKLAKKYWPGALSIILQIKSPPTPLLQSGESEPLPLKKGGGEGFEIPVRVSSNKTARAISRGLRHPIISTSANVSGKKTLHDVKEIIREFSAQGGSASGGKNKKHRPDLILDAGKLPRRLPSTIIKIENNKIIVLRQGEVEVD